MPDILFKVEDSSLSFLLTKYRLLSLQKAMLTAKHRFEQGREEVFLFVLVVVLGGAVEVAQHRIGGLLRRGIAPMLVQVDLQTFQRSALLFHTGVAGRQHVQRRLGARGRAGETRK